MLYIPEERRVVIKAKFDKKHSVLPSGCWLWQGGFDSSGYGWFWFGLRKERAHRVAFMLEGKQIQKGHGVFHTCDDPSCVNPLHLFSGPQKDNLVDMARKGRHGRAKLTPEQATFIKGSQESAGALARRFAVSPATVWHIRAGRTHNY